MVYNWISSSVQILECETRSWSRMWGSQRADWRSTPSVTRTGAILSLVSSAMIRGFLALGKNGEHSLYRIWHYKYHTYRVILYAIRQDMGVFYQSPQTYLGHHLIKLKVVSQNRSHITCSFEGSTASCSSLDVSSSASFSRSVVSSSWRKSSAVGLVVSSMAMLSCSSWYISLSSSIIVSEWSVVWWKVYPFVFKMLWIM